MRAMSKRSTVLVFLLAVAAAACGGGEGGAAYDDPGSIETCDAVVDAAIDLVEDFVAAAEELQIADLAATEEPAAVAESGAAADALTARAVELGCSLDEVNAEITERAADVEVDPDNLVGLFFRNAVTSPETDLLE
jgi:hypothetical protein